MNGVRIVVYFGEHATPAEFVWQDREDAVSSLHGWAEMLAEISTHYGPQDMGRHAAARVVIRVEPGDKYEGGSACPSV